MNVSRRSLSHLLPRAADIAAASSDLQSGKTRRGVVLIVVLVLVVMVSLAGFGFLSAMSTEYEAARLNGSMRQARQTLASAESTLAWMAGLSEQQRELMGGLHNNPNLFQGRIVMPLTMAGSSVSQPTLPLGAQSNSNPNEPLNDNSIVAVDDRWRFSMVAIEPSLDQTRVLRFGLRNESSKLNLASVLRWDQASPGQGRLSLMQLPGMTEPIADCLLDWCDADETPREFGAESEYYQSLDQPYRAANAVPQRLSELLYVKGVSRFLLMGSGSINNNSADASFSSPADASGSLTETGAISNPAGASNQAWMDLLTVWSAERDQSRNGRSRVLLNAGSLSTLQEQLSPVLPENMVRYILLARIYGLQLPTESSGESAASGVEPDAAPFSLSTTPAFSIASVGDLLNSTVIVTSSAGSIVVQSPLQSSLPDSESLARAVFDATTTHPEKVIYGRIHLKSASEVVLRTIPGLTPELTSQIVTTRDSLEPAEANSVVWLLSRNVLDAVTFRKVFPEITTGGDVFETELVVHRTIGGPMLRRNVVLDAASIPPRRLHWVDRTDLPFDFPLQFLQPQPLP